MKALLTTIIALSSLSTLAATPLATPDNRLPSRQPIARPIILGRPVQPKSNSIQSSDIVLAKIVKINPGMSTRSLPPQTNCTIEIEVIRVVRGNEPSKTINYRYVGFDIGFKEGDTVLFQGNNMGGQTHFTSSTTGDKIDEVLSRASVLPGWELTGKDLVSPWARAKITWPKNWKGPTAEKSCKLTGRPAYTLDSHISMTVEQVKAEVVKEYQNPFGDGKFKITLKNTSNKEVAIPSLLKNKDKILWEESLVIMIDESQGTKISDNQLPAEVSYVTLKPNETISYEFNTLNLKGINWPRGGNRVYFSFCLGDKQVRNFFYYYSSLHDAMLPK